MRAPTLRRLINLIGLLVALITAIAIPATYASISYMAQGDLIAADARLNASRVARYIYQHTTMWTFHKVRLVEVIELSSGKEEKVRQRIFAAESKLILEDGDALSSPTMMRSAPILVSGKEVGRIEVEVSLRSLLKRTFTVLLFSLCLGLLAYLSIRILPLRALDRTIRQLGQREDELTATNQRFEAALSNMPHGLSMFDAQDRLVLCNARYAEMYGLPPDMTKPETEQAKIFAFRDAAGLNIVGTTPVSQGTDVDGCRDTVLLDNKLQDGRTIRITQKSMQTGGFITSHEDITAIREAETRIIHMAYHDALTELPNRVLFRQEMARTLTLTRQGESFSVLCLDLDHFKAVNDTLGHPIGDALLRQVANRLRGCVRDTDLVARLGGDEFAVVQARTTEPHVATGLAQRIIETLSAPYELDGHQVVIGVSIGIAVGPDDSEDADLLMKAADMALYRAKAEGRGTYRFFEAEMDAKMQARRALELDLRGALQNGEFEVHYQPLVNLAANKVSGFEALLRWTHPDRGRVSPADFIPLAEEIGAINQIGAWVLRQACMDAAQWPDDVRVAVNLSSVQFKSQTLVLDVLSALGASGLPPKRLELEITESVMLQETEATLVILHQLRALGIRISMDDFGTGYSSLSYLRKFPFDKIKIDQSFVRDLPDQADSVAIVRAVTGLGTSLGMSTTAEGVETQGQLDKLRAEGCTEVQGWLFSKACPASEVAGLLSSVAKRCLDAA